MLIERDEMFQSNTYWKIDDRKFQWFIPFYMRLLKEQGTYITDSRSIGFNVSTSYTTTSTYSLPILIYAKGEETSQHSSLTYVRKLCGCLSLVITLQGQK